MSKNNKKILLYKKENNLNNFNLSEQIADGQNEKSFIKVKDTDDNILIKNKEKIKKIIKSNKSKKIILENNYKNILIILLIQILIILVNSQDDVSSRYEMTIIMSGQGTLKLFNDIFQIIPSYIKVNEEEIKVNGSYLYDLKEDEFHIITIRWETEITNCSYMFSGLSNLKKVSLLSFDFSKVVDMSNMFSDCDNLVSIQFSSPDTSKVTDMREIFSNCKKLINLDLSQFSTILVTNMDRMFYNCKALTSLNLSLFDTSLVTNMDYMFYQCSNLKYLDVSNFNTEKVTKMYKMFYLCKNLLSLDLSSFTTSLLITNLDYMFYSCSLLKNLNLSNFDTSKTTRMEYMFSNCFSLEELNLSNFNTELVANMTCMFFNCYNLKSLDTSNFNTENCIDMSYMFYNCSALISLNLSRFNTQKVQSMENMFIKCNNLQTLDISNFNFQLVSHSFNIFQNLYSLKYLNMKNVDTKNIQNMSYTFYNLKSLVSLDLSNFNTDKVTNMSYMFEYCTSLESLNLINFNTSKVRDMKYMFYDCNNLKSLDLSSFNTINVVYMNNMFMNCIKLESINLLSFNTEKVSSMQNMFYNCSSLESLDLSSFKTRNLSYIRNMIYSCPKLVSLDISNFVLNGIFAYSSDYCVDYYSNSSTKTYYSYKYSLNFLTNVKSLKYLNLKNVEATNINDFNCYFCYLTNLISVDLSNFKASNGIRMAEMFSGCNKLEYVHLPNFINKTIYYMNKMFYNCQSLKSLDMSMINTRSVFQIGNIFSGCNSLISLDISNFDLYSISSFSFLSDLTKLQYLNLSNIKTYQTNLSKTFYNLNSLISIDLTNINISSAIYLEDLFYNCLSLESVDLSNFDLQKVRNMKYLFNNCIKLKFVNFSNLNTSNVEYMDYMFKNCHSLISLDLSNLDTSSVKSMEGMFYNCSNLEYVNLKNINTNSTEKMNKMLYKCSNLKYINLYSINKDVQTITDIFSESSANFTYCIKNETKIMSIFQKLLLLKDTKRDCTSHCYNYDLIYIPEEAKCEIKCNIFEDKKYSFNNECYESCPKRTYLLEGFICIGLICEHYYDYEQMNCIDEIPEGYFLNDTELQTIDKCHPDCKTCDKKGSENNTNCRTCFEEKYLLYGNCVSHCENGFFIDKEDNDIKKCKCEDKRCFKCSQDSLRKKMCISCNDNYYRIFNDLSNIEPYFNCYSEPEGYYLDKNDNFYKKCYSTCKTCHEKGNNTDHKCDECKSSFSFKFNNNCYIKCNYYFYFDEFNDYYCTKAKRCSNEYNKLIESKGRCVDDCKIDDKFRYEFQKICLEECPIFSKPSEEDEFRCIADCPEDRPYEIIKTQECVKNCSIIELMNYECIINNKKAPLSKDLKYDLAYGFLMQYLNGDFDSLNISLQNGISFSIGNMRLEIINYDSQTINDKNETNIRLGVCEKKLREYYHIPDNETLLIFKIEEYEVGLKMPIIQYKIFKEKGRENLDLNICNGYKIDIIVPVSINEDELYKYNITSDYYNSICFAYTSENGTDIPLKDRQDDFVKNNMTLCEENCDLSEYDKKIKKAVCKCDIKTDMSLSNKKDFNMTEFYNYFLDIKRVANLDVMKCYRNLFTKEGILNNYISFIILPIIFFNIISYIIFHCRDFNLIRNKLKDIISFKKIMESLNSNKKNGRNNGQNIEQLQENNKNKKDFLEKRQIAVVNDVWRKTNKNNDINKKNKEEKEEKDFNIAVSNPNKKKARNSKKIIIIQLVH